MVRASIDWCVDTTKAASPQLVLFYAATRGSSEPLKIEDAIALETTEPYFGGLRWWFQCECGRRCAKLYLPPGALRFKCRTCHRLRYSSQRETQAKRLSRREDKIRMRLRADSRGIRCLRPRWMRRRTYHRLRAELRDLDRRWLLGIANLRGHLLPLVDVKLLLGSGRTTLRRTSRVISVNHREVPAGLVVDEVLGFRRFADQEFTDKWPETIVRCDRFLTGAYQRGEDTRPVFNLFDFVESNLFLQAAAE